LVSFVFSPRQDSACTMYVVIVDRLEKRSLKRQTFALYKLVFYFLDCLLYAFAYNGHLARPPRDCNNSTSSLTDLNSKQWMVCDGVHGHLWMNKRGQLNTFLSTNKMRLICANALKIHFGLSSSVKRYNYRNARHTQRLPGQQLLLRIQLRPTIQS
jgi:hypothetical protein